MSDPAVSPARAVYCALVHHPVRDREGHPLTSAITNVDVHDIARSARTFGLAGYFVVSPIAAQRLIVDRILEHWRTGAGARRVPERSDALSRCHPVASIDEACARIEADHGEAPERVVTEARPVGRTIVSYAAARAHLASPGRPALILFGTAHGLHASVIERAELVIEPIQGVGAYNHLSVRAAAAITFDRLFSR
ncbi:MAG: RNA methyltransferase [Sandaracinaceae bacterium]|nr:RNA methyltransferase [Sandaracinaceae bacterium]